MPNMSYTSRSIASVPGWTSNSVGTVASDSGTWTRTRIRRPAARSRRLVTTSKRSGATPSGNGRPGWVMKSTAVTSTHIV